MIRILLLALLCFSPSLFADTGIPAFTVADNADGGKDYTITLQVVALMTMLSFIPAVVIMMTSFTRIVIVLGILRQAIGLPFHQSHLLFGKSKERTLNYITVCVISF